MQIHYIALLSHSNTRSYLCSVQEKGQGLFRHTRDATTRRPQLNAVGILGYMIVRNIDFICHSQKKTYKVDVFYINDGTNKPLNVFI